MYFKDIEEEGED